MKKLSILLFGIIYINTLAYSIDYGDFNGVYSTNIKIVNPNLLFFYNSKSSTFYTSDIKGEIIDSLNFSHFYSDLKKKNAKRIFYGKNVLNKLDDTIFYTSVYKYQKGFAYDIIQIKLGKLKAKRISINNKKVSKKLSLLDYSFVFNDNLILSFFYDTYSINDKYDDFASLILIDQFGEPTIIKTKKKNELTKFSNYNFSEDFVKLKNGSLYRNNNNKYFYLGSKMEFNISIEIDSLLSIYNLKYDKKRFYFDEISNKLFLQVANPGGTCSIGLKLLEVKLSENRRLTISNEHDFNFNYLVNIFAIYNDEIYIISNKNTIEKFKLN